MNIHNKAKEMLLINLQLCDTMLKDKTGSEKFKQDIKTLRQEAIRSYGEYKRKIREIRRS